MRKIIDRLAQLSAKLKGALLCLFLSCSVLFLFFGSILTNPNKYYFDNSGEGLLSYYCATYHLKYDSTYWHLQAMNYPHGENVFFTSNQPIISAGLKFVNNHITKVEDLVPGIFNLIMIFSIPLCALFLFLIFNELKIHYVFAALSAVGIAFLCSDVTRMRGHFALAYTFAIPALFYLIMRYDKAPGVKKNLIIGLFVFLISCLHLYYLGICAAILLIYSFTRLFVEKRFFTGLKNAGIEVLIHLVLPYFVLQTLIRLTDDVTDRTQHPWGFLEYVSNFDGIFFPFNKPYGDVIQRFYTPSEVSVEGLNYAGAFAILFSIFFLIYRLCTWMRIRFKKTFIPLRIKCNGPFLSKDRVLNIFLVTGIIMAIYSCGIPFIYKRDLVRYAGLLAQMRSLGRFGWIFYYALNIFGVYVVYQWITPKKNVYLKLVAFILPLFMLFYDGYYQLSILTGFIHNKVPVLDDVANDLPENKWLKQLDFKKYQAIIPLPYFLRGSENTGIEPNNPDIISKAYIVSMKTGLPITSAVLSRTSMSQSIENLAMVLEPYRPLKIVDHFPNKKPFLLVVLQNNDLNYWQKNLVNKAKYLLSGQGCSVYELPHAGLATISDSLFAKKARQLSGLETFSINNWFSSTNKKNFAYKGFDELKTTSAYRGNGSYVGNIKDYNRIYEDTIPGAMGGQNYSISFWMNNFNVDLYPRTTIEVMYMDSASNIPYNSYWVTAASLATTYDGSWSLLETTLKPAHGHDKIVITLWNPEIYDDSKIIIDELLIRPEETDLFRIFPGELETNNRFYKGKFNLTHKMIGSSRKQMILEFERQIRNSPDWLKQIREKAKAWNKPVDEVIKRDAEFLMQEREKAEKENY